MSYGEATLRHHLRCFDQWMSDPAVTEIVVNEPGRYAVERAGIWSWHDAPSLTFNRLDGIGVLSAGMTSQTLSTYQPRASSVLPGGLRIQVMRPPAVADGKYSLTIRKRATDFTPTLEWLDEGGYFAHLDPKKDWVAYWRNAVETRRTILLTGLTGSSKTTFAEGLVRAIPLWERIITLEKTPEWLSLPHPLWVALYYGSAGDGEASSRAAVACLEDALRMRPDRIPVGELRAPGEAWGYLRSLMAYSGGITTIHAEDAKGGFDALALMLREDRAGQTMGDADLRALLRKHIHIVAHCARDPYRVTEVWEVEHA